MARHKIDCCTPDCPKRSGDCHSTCKEYKKQRAELDAGNLEKQKQLDVKYSLDCFMFDNIQRNAKRNNSKHRKGF
jgi:hypothetical protein